MLNNRKSLPSINRRKSSDVVNLEKNKLATKQSQTKNETHDKSEAHEHKSTVKKPDTPVSMNTHRKSDADKSLHADAAEKVSGEPYVHEFKEFAGVTIIFRTAPNPRAFGSFDAHGRTGMHGARRKSEFQHSQLNTQDKSEHVDKTDHTGASYPIFTAKSDASINNSNDTSNNDNQH